MDKMNKYGIKKFFNIDGAELYAVEIRHEAAAIFSVFASEEKAAAYIKKEVDSLEKIAPLEYDKFFVFSAGLMEAYKEAETGRLFEGIATGKLYIDEVREVIAINEAIKATTKRINAERRKEAAALKAAAKPNKSEFITAYIYSYGTTKTYAAAMYKKVVIEEGNTAYYNAIIDGYKNDSRKAFCND